MDEIIKSLLENGGGNLLSTGIVGVLSAAWFAIHNRKPSKAEEKQIEKAAASMLVTPSPEDVRKYGVPGRVTDGARKAATSKKKRSGGFAMKKTLVHSSYAKKTASKASSAKKATKRPVTKKNVRKAKSE